MEKHESAIADLDQAIRLDPEETEQFYSRGVALLDTNKVDKAIADFDVVIRRNPKHAEALVKRGIAWRLKTECEKSVADLSEAIRLDARNPEIWAEARERVGKACELTAWKDADHLSTLAAAHAEAGDFEAARRGRQTRTRFIPGLRIARRAKSGSNYIGRRNRTGTRTNRGGEVVALGRDRGGSEPGHPGRLPAPGSHRSRLAP